MRAYQRSIHKELHLDILNRMVPIVGHPPRYFLRCRKRLPRLRLSPFETNLHIILLGIRPLYHLGDNIRRAAPRGFTSLNKGLRASIRQHRDAHPVLACLDVSRGQIHRQIVVGLAFFKRNLVVLGRDISEPSILIIKVYPHMDRRRQIFLLRFVLQLHNQRIHRLCVERQHLVEGVILPRPIQLKLQIGRHHRHPVNPLLLNVLNLSALPEPIVPYRGALRIIACVGIQPAYKHLHINLRRVG